MYFELPDKKYFSISEVSKLFSVNNSLIRFWEKEFDQLNPKVKPSGIRKFTKEAYKLGINYLGVCCGANPMLIREVAEAVGLTVPASKYRENMSNHFMYGTNKRIPKHMKDYRKKA